jgi:hypothetical protein
MIVWDRDAATPRKYQLFPAHEADLCAIEPVALLYCCS